MRTLLIAAVAIGMLTTAALSAEPAGKPVIRSAEINASDLAVALDTEMWKYSVPASGSQMKIRAGLELWKNGKRESVLAMTPWLTGVTSAATVLVAVRHPDQELAEAKELSLLVQLRTDGSRTGKRARIENPLRGHGAHGTFRANEPDGREVMLIGARKDGVVTPDRSGNDVAIVLVIETLAGD